MTELMQLRTPQKLKELVKRVAGEKGISANAQVLQILWDWASKQMEYAEVEK